MRLACNMNKLDVLRDRYSILCVEIEDRELAKYACATSIAEELCPFVAGDIVAKKKRWYKVIEIGSWGCGTDNARKVDWIIKGVRVRRDLTINPDNSSTVWALTRRDELRQVHESEQAQAKSRRQ